MDERPVVKAAALALADHGLPGWAAKAYAAFPVRCACGDLMQVCDYHEHLAQVLAAAGLLAEGVS